MILAIDRDTANAETYFIAYHAYRSDAGAHRLTQFGGRYLDRLERRDGRWGIVDRLVVHDWSDDRETIPYEHVAAFPQGSRAADDASSGLFGGG
jgi:hypothetical protein